MAAVFMGLVTLLSEFGLGITVVTLRHLDSYQVAQLNALAIIIGGISFVVSWLASLPLGWFFGAPELPAVVVIMSTTFLITSFRVVPAALLKRELQFKVLALIEGTQAFILALTMVLLAWAGFGYWTLVAGSIIGAAVSTVLTLCCRRHEYSLPNLTSLGNALTFTRQQIVGNVAWYVYSNADFLIAGRVLGKAPLGVYTIAWSLARTIPEKVSSLIIDLTPAYFSAVQDNLEELQRYLLKLTTALSLVIFPVLIGLAIVADDVVALALGEQWAGAVTPLRLLSIYAAYDSVTKLLSRVLTVRGETRFLMRLGLILALLMPISFYIGSHWGPTGIATAWLVVHPVTRLPVLLKLRKALKIRLSEYFSAFWPAVSGSAVMIAALVLLRIQIPFEWSHSLRLMSQITVGALVYVGTLALWHRRDLVMILRVLPKRSRTARLPA